MYMFKEHKKRSIKEAIKEYLLGTIIISIVFLLIMISSINVIPSIEEEVHSAFSQLVNQYKRRADLVPQLVKVVRASTEFEQKTLERVINARSKALEASSRGDLQSNPEAMKKYQQAQNELRASISKFMIVVERYPDIKSTQNFLTLQSQIEGNENRISVARRDYILSIKNFNTAIRTFPGWLWNKLFFRHLPIEYYSEEASTSVIPELNFN